MSLDGINGQFRHCWAEKDDFKQSDEIQAVTFPLWELCVNWSSILPYPKTAPACYASLIRYQDYFELKNEEYAHYIEANS